LTAECVKKTDKTSLDIINPNAKFFGHSGRRPGKPAYTE